MTILHITLFGGFRMRDMASSADIKITTNLQLLLAFLLLFRHRAYSRDVIMDVFWGEQDQAHARACLNTALWRIRRILEPRGLVDGGSYLITTPSGEIIFNCAGCWLDVAEFERLIAPALEKPVSSLQSVDVQQLEEGLRLYQGELLEGVYADWALQARERYREMYLTALYCLMGHYTKRSNYNDAIRCGQLILRNDPLREHIHRDLMRLYSDSGQRSQAILQYQKCAQVLKTELGIAPMMETQLLYEQIMSDRSDVRGTDDISQAAQDLFSLFAEVQQQFRRVLSLLDHTDR